MSLEQWSAVDRYFTEALRDSDAVLEEVLRANAQTGLPPIDVSPSQGKLLQLIAQMLGAKRILEIGTLGGYSTICLARGLPTDGLLVTLEFEPKHAEVARKNVDRAGVGHLVQIITGSALETLPKLKARFPEPFDLFFIDADKQSALEYFNWAIKLSHPGSVIIADNVVRNGEILNPKSLDLGVPGMRRLIEALSKESQVSATAIQTVGAKGYDGFVLARVL
ncbi:MAG: O-methyltransferase [Planctomycetes bacterium]|nr:O-methyltransferase [Planctomycetota bacterium]